MLTLREDAVKMYFLGVELYAFGLYVALGLALGLTILAVLLKKAKWQSGAAALTGLLSMALGLIFSRLFYGLMDDALGRPLPLWAMLRLNTGGYSMMGALAGACLGAFLAGKLLKQESLRLLDFLAPALMLFVACERLGEGYSDEFGVSRVLLSPIFENFFLAVEDDFGWKLCTYLLESFTALILCLVLLRDEKPNRRAGDTFLKMLILYGATQILMESLRYDQHMTVNAYVKYQQVMAMLLLAGGVIVLALRMWNKKRGLAVAALADLPVTVGLGVAIEFMIDRTDMNRFLLYLAFVAVVAVQAALGLKLRKGENP